MRRLILAAALLLAAPRRRSRRGSRRAPRVRRRSLCDAPRSARASSPGACGRARTTRNRSCARRSTRRLKSIDSRQGLMSSQKARWRRALERSAGAVGDLARFGMPGRRAVRGGHGGDRAREPRLSCIIDYDAERAASLKARYP